jgi:aminoglycoside 6'-N-acetyltransferase
MEHYTVRSVTRGDLDLLASWLREPHVARWWGDPTKALAEIDAALTDPSTQPMIVELQGEPIAYLQQYDPHMEKSHPYRDQPRGTLGLDLTIGRSELVGVGHGSAMLRRHADQLFGAGVPRLIIDPHPDNSRAIRAYEKAGFRRIGERTLEDGPVVLMARDRAN